MKNRNGALDILKFLFAVEVVFYLSRFAQNVTELRAKRN